MRLAIAPHSQMQNSSLEPLCRHNEARLGPVPRASSRAVVEIFSRIRYSPGFKLRFCVSLLIVKGIIGCPPRSSPRLLFCFGRYALFSFPRSILLANSRPIKSRSFSLRKGFEKTIASRYSGLLGKRIRGLIPNYENEGFASKVEAVVQSRNHTVATAPGDFQRDNEHVRFQRGERGQTFKAVGDRHHQEAVVGEKKRRSSPRRRTSLSAISSMASIAGLIALIPSSANSFVRRPTDTRTVFQSPLCAHTKHALQGSFVSSSR